MWVNRKNLGDPDSATVWPWASRLISGPPLCHLVYEKFVLDDLTALSSSTFYLWNNTNKVVWIPWKERTMYVPHHNPQQVCNTQERLLIICGQYLQCVLKFTKCLLQTAFHALISWNNHYHLSTLSMSLILSEYFGLSFPPHKSLEEAKIIFGSDPGKQTVRKLKELPQHYCQTSEHLHLYFTASAIVHLGCWWVIYSYSPIWLPAFSKAKFPKVSSTKHPGQRNCIENSFYGR